MRYLVLVGTLALTGCNDPYTVTQDQCSNRLVALAGKLSDGDHLDVRAACPTARYVCVLDDYLDISAYAIDPSPSPLSTVDRGCPHLQTRGGDGRKLVVVHERSCPSIVHIGTTVRASGDVKNSDACVPIASSEVIRTVGSFPRGQIVELRGVN